MFLNEGVNVRRNRQNDNYKSDSSKSSKKQLTPGEAYYESDEGVQKYTSERQVEMVTLIRKSDDRLRVIESTGQSRLLDEYYELVFKNRKGHIATNFTYTLTNGNKDKLYNIKAEYTLLFFY